MATPMDGYKVFDAHFPKRISKAIEKFATDVAFQWSRYIFTRRVGGIQFGYCTHCRKEYMTEKNLKHNEDWQCKRCKSLCIVKASGKGRKYMVDDVYFVYYEKSMINPQAMVARGIYAVRDYTGDYYKVETQYKDVAKYLYEPGRARKFVRYYFSDHWIERKRISSESLNLMKHKRCYYSPDSIVDAAHGINHFQYCTWENYDAGDRVDFFALAAKYPCIEYLTKLGLRRIVEAKLCGDELYRTINWRGKNLQAVLRVGKKELNDIRNSGLPIDASTLRYYHLSKHRGYHITITEAYELKDLGSERTFEELVNKLGRRTLDQAHKYIMKQLRKSDHYRSGASVWYAWRDYMRDCRELGMELDQDHIFFPNDLYTAHQKTIKKVKLKADRSLNIKIIARVKELAGYRFEQDGLLIRPAKSSNELFAEAKALQHCVGGYAKTYAEGKTNLFVIRKTDDPDIPFYTMEIKEDKITQTYGLKNCLPTEEVESFIKAFSAAKLKKKKRKGKGKAKIAQPA